ncbi:MAG: PAS domain-containing protein [Polaromonas sp.]
MTAPRQQTQALRYALEFVPDIKPDGLVPLEAVLCTEELSRRPTRPPAYEAENQAMAILLQALADSPPTVLQTLADTLLEVFQADSAGISLLTKDEKSFVWTAIAGAWKAHAGGATPRDFGPCGDVFDGKVPLLFKHFERRYPGLLAATPLAEECLVLPFYVDGKAVGTIWLMAHDTRRKFDAEDLRQLENFGRFASAAYRATALLDAAIEQGRARIDQHVASNFEDVTQRKQAEEKLAQQAAELASLYATAPVGLFMLDRELRFVRINRVLAELNGLPAEQHIGRALRELLKPELADDVEPLLRQILETGQQVLNHEVQGATVPRSDEPRHWLVNYHPVLAADGTIRCVHGAVKDITERKLTEQVLRESKHFLRSCVDALSGHIAVLDESGTILEINEAWRQFAIENQAVQDRVDVGINYLQHCEQALAPGGEVPAYVTGIKDVIAGRRTRFEMEYACHSPTQQRWFVMRVSRFHNPGPVRVIIVHDDCTERKLAEYASHESEERYRNLFNSMDEGFCIIEMIFDEHGQAVDCRLLEVNPAVEKQRGVQLPVGKRLREISPDIEAEWLKVCGKVALTGEPQRFVYEQKALDSHWFDMYALRLGGPENPKVAMIFNNITERTKAAETLRQSEERFRALFYSGPIAMYSCDASGIIQEFNRNALVLWGREPVRGDASERFCGAFKLYFPDGTFMPHAQSPIAAVLKGEAPVEHGVEVIIERPDGSRSTIIANIVPLKNARGEITGAMNCMYDITERSRLERKTQQQAQALADLHRRKDEFLAMLSHELRNPLAPLASAVQVLRLQGSGAPLPQQACDVIERQVGQLKHLVDDLLEISRITTGSVRLRQQRVSVSDVVERALETVQPLIVQRRHELTVSLPPQPVWLHADATRLEQVLVNLLTNAAKYTDEGGRIWLSVEQEDAAEVVLKVRDTGIGIASELLPRIFELFTQAERSIDRSQGGLGIGLSLVQRMVELHAGTVKVYSVLGQGSEFVVRLPVMPTAMPPSTPPPFVQPAQPPGKACRVLAVDDNVDAVQSLAMLLKMSGHEVELAYDGPSALEAALAMRPDVVLLDIGLPGLTGYEVAQQLRQQAGFSDIVLVALTGYGRETDRQLSQEAGFDYHLVKPANFHEVEQILALVGKQAA